MHLELDIYSFTQTYPQEYIKNLGIEYSHIWCSTMADFIIFWNCRNVPKNLPDGLKISERNPELYRNDYDEKTFNEILRIMEK